MRVSAFPRQKMDKCLTMRLFQQRTMVNKNEKNLHLVCSKMILFSVEAPSAPQGHKIVELMKDGGGLGFSIEGGFDSPNGDKPLQIKKIFMGMARYFFLEF